MSRKKNDVIDFRIFTRPAADGRRTFYIRFIDSMGSVFLTRATDAPNAAKAGAIAQTILDTEDLAAMAKAKREGREDLQDEIARMAALPVRDCLRLFWDRERSPYVQDQAAAGKPLSGSYLHENLSNVENCVSNYEAFLSLPMNELGFRHVDSFIRSLHRQGKSRYVINSAIDTLRTPCSWFAARKLIDRVDFSGLTLPAAKAKERGILSAIEIDKILALETTPLWNDKEGRPHAQKRPRPRLAGKERNTENPQIDFREKLFVVLGIMTGARKGELRALRWQDIDLAEGLIHIEWNYTDLDGLKAPKAKSRRKVVIPMSLEPLLLEARKIAQVIGADAPDCFVIMNAADFKKPVSDTTIKRAWVRVLSAIGINEDERKDRNLLVHGLRHGYATRLVDAGMTFAEAGKLTGHRVVATLGRYADHVSDETLGKARDALNANQGKPVNGKS